MLTVKHIAVNYWPDWCFVVQIGMQYVGSLSGKREEVCDEVRKIIDMCCLQEVKWRAQRSRMLAWKETDIICGGPERRWSRSCGSYGEGRGV